MHPVVRNLEDCGTRYVLVELMRMLHFVALVGMMTIDITSQTYQSQLPKIKLCPLLEIPWQLVEMSHFYGLHFLPITTFRPANLRVREGTEQTVSVA